MAAVHSSLVLPNLLGDTLNFTANPFNATAQDGCVHLSDSYGTEYSDSNMVKNQFCSYSVVWKTCLSHHAVSGLCDTSAILQFFFFSLHTSVCIFGTIACVNTTFLYSVVLFQWYQFHAALRGRTKMY